MNKKERIISLLEQGRASRNLQEIALAQKEIIVLIQPIGDMDDNNIEEVIAAYMSGQTTSTAAEVAAVLVRKNTIINLTPHTVSIVNADNEIVREFPSAGVARVATKNEVVGEINGIPISRTTFGDVVGLPDPDGNVYIVSMVVAQAVSGRSDVVAPDSGPSAYRYQEGPQKGQIIGVRGFVRY